VPHLGKVATTKLGRSFLLFLNNPGGQRTVGVFGGNSFDKNL
jgi:hypothetical protein